MTEERFTYWFFLVSFSLLAALGTILGLAVIGFFGYGLFSIISNGDIYTRLGLTALFGLTVGWGIYFRDKVPFGTRSG